MDSDTQDFPFVHSLPKREKKKLFSLWDNLTEYRISVQTYGPPVAPIVAAKLLGISRQRLHQIRDRFQTIIAPDGSQYFSADSVAEYAKKERIGGRPPLSKNLR
jgi:hypothetical protein